MIQAYLRNVFFGIAILTLSIVSGCQTAPDTVSGQTELKQRANAALAYAKKADPSLSKFLSQSPGYAVFPSIGKGAVGIGGAYGKGVLYEGGIVVGYCDMSQGTIGVQLGGQTYSEIIAFENRAALDRFKQSNFNFSAQATAVALKSGAGANAKYTDGVAVFTMAESGLMYEASIGGQKFRYQN